MSVKGIIVFCSCAVVVSSQSDGSGDGEMCGSPLVSGAIAGAFIGGLSLGVLASVAVVLICHKVVQHRTSIKDRTKDSNQEPVTYSRKDAVKSVKEYDFLDTASGQVVRTLEPPTMPAPPAPPPPPTAAKPKKKVSAPLPVPLYPTQEYDIPMSRSLGKSIISDTLLTRTKGRQMRRSMSLEQLRALGVSNTDVEIMYDEGLAQPTEDYYIMDPPSSIPKSKSSSKINETPKYANVGSGKRV